MSQFQVSLIINIVMYGTIFYRNHRRIVKSRLEVESKSKSKSDN